MKIRFYGYRVDLDHFNGRLGQAVKMANSVREFSERATEVLAVIHDSVENEEPLIPVLGKLWREGVLQPAPPKTRSPVKLLNFKREQDDTDLEDRGIKGRSFSTRDYSARQGRRLDVEREDRLNGKTYDSGFSLRSQLAHKRSRSNRYISDPVVVERFHTGE